MKSHTQKKPMFPQELISTMTIKIIIVCKRIGIGDDKADMGIDCSVFRDQFCNPFGPGMNQNLQLRFLFAGSGYGVCPCEE